MSRLKGERVRWGVTKCDRGGGSVALRDVTPVDFLFVKLALSYLLTFLCLPAFIPARNQG